MDGTEDAAGEEYGTIRLDCLGQVTIPTELHDELDLETVTRGSKWGDEAFRDAGDATFGG